MSIFTTIILAAGNGTRMKSDMPKVMHKVANKPMLWHVLRAAEAAGASKNIVIVQDSHEDVKKLALSFPSTEFAVQKEQRGTGDAVKAAQENLQDFDGNIVILSGDCPNISADDISNLLNSAKSNQISLIAFSPLDPAQYGRVITSENKVLGIVEYKDASEEQRNIDVCNSGIYALPAKLLFSLLDELKSNNAQGEYYLTDIVTIAASKGIETVFCWADENNVLGINDKAELAAAEAIMQDNLCQAAMKQGTTLIDQGTTFLSADTKIGRNVVIKPFTYIDENVEIGDDVTIGPFAHIRHATKIGKGAKIGNFVEIKKSNIGAGSKISHLSYIGDANLGENVNIGAGTITCNYDGFKKYKTDIGNGVFVGSNSSLIAPLEIEEGAIIAAGSTITEKVVKDSIGIARSEQKNLAEKALSFRNNKSSSEK